MPVHLVTQCRRNARLEQIHHPANTILNGRLRHSVVSQPISRPMTSLPAALTLPSATTWPWMTAAILLWLALAVQRRRKYARLPPGPTPLPIVGNILDFPRTHLGREFAAYTKQFGEFYYLEVFSQQSLMIRQVTSFTSTCSAKTSPSSGLLRLPAICSTRDPRTTLIALLR